MCVVYSVDSIYFILLSIAFFFMCLLGVLFHFKNFILVLVCLDLALVTCAFGFILISYFSYNSVGYFYALFLLGVAASETAVGLGLLILYYRLNQTTNLSKL